MYTVHCTLLYWVLNTMYTVYCTLCILSTEHYNTVFCKQCILCTELFYTVYCKICVLCSVNYYTVYCTLLYCVLYTILLRFTLNAVKIKLKRTNLRFRSFFEIEMPLWRRQQSFHFILVTTVFIFIKEKIGELNWFECIVCYVILSCLTWTYQLNLLMNLVHIYIESLFILLSHFSLI